MYQNVDTVLFITSLTQTSVSVKCVQNCKFATSFMFSSMTLIWNAQTVQNLLHSLASTYSSY